MPSVSGWPLQPLEHLGRVRVTSTGFYAFGFELGFERSLSGGWHSLTRRRFYALGIGLGLQRAVEFHH
jgi:hypothetical protein